MRQFRFSAAAAILLLISGPAAAQLADSTEFVEAVRKNDGDKATQLLEKHPFGLIDSRGENGDTALVIAITRRDEDWTAFLLNKGASPDRIGKNDTPLIAAARVGFDDAVDWLIDLHAKVDADNRMGETPLIVAVQQHRPAMVKKLLSAGANPDKTDYSGYSARDYAKRDQRARDIAQIIDAAKPKPSKS